MLENKRDQKLREFWISPPLFSREYGMNYILDMKCKKILLDF